MIVIVSKSRVIPGLRESGLVMLNMNEPPRRTVDLCLEDVEPGLERDLFGSKKVSGGAHDVELLAPVNRGS